MVKSKILDFAERVGWTFVQTFLGVLIAQQIVVGKTHWAQLLYGALIAGGVAAAKVIIAQNIGGTTSGSLPDTAAPPKA